MQLKRRHIMTSLAGIAVALTLGSSALAQGVPQAGVEYRVADQPQPVSTGKKVEVTEFFGYFCPGCNAFEPHFEDWIKRQGDRIVVKRLHSDLHEVTTQQKLYFTLEAMGKVDELQMKAFNAFHIDRNRLSTDAEVMKFVEKQGLDKKRFTELYNNAFMMDGKLRTVKQLQAAYKISGIPTVIIEGKYIVSPLEISAKAKAPGNSQKPGLAVMDYLVEKVYNEKNPPAANTATSKAASTPATPATSKKK
ncbi:thiol:disulfide interchange protein DsbA/DsbL [Undibacterium cyanobacteriorum]|uniref:Thiol:disulfide interchange protein DsbA n=1 Tax=Undibacterium cyanobacteriorum TaxID=3073561 RepID=A0ABY9RHV3_9BURK|nr:thiol:disulfide interchange protein DsbA/DsbL [Undibacterium sp. 20NA77.5]WMW80434.1 thiol:disulfide interchange protein DsbA/DsbL [Undibacterium sp. 20NA77.5]